MRTKVFLSATAIVTLCIVVSACSVAPGKPTIAIVSPPHGSEFREGENVAVQSVATDAAGINRIELMVDGAVVRSDSPLGGGQASFPVVQNWKATQGTHTISVRAYNVTGIASDPVAVSVLILPRVAPTSMPVPPTALPPPTAMLPPPTANQPAPPPTVQCTNSVAFVADVTVPPGTVWSGGQTFNKIWRVMNDGTCAWDTRYELVSVGGESMATSTVIPISSTAPGATADLLVAMTAPSTPGTHTGQWQIRGPNGLFGAPLTVSIDVAAAAQPAAPGCAGAPTIDFFQASPATITAGQSTTLLWGKVDNATSAVIDQGIGGVGTPGSTNVSPATTTTYTLSATGCGGTVTKQATVTVTGSGQLIPAQPLVPLLPLLPKGNLILQEIFLSTGNEVILRVANDPTGSLSGSFSYKLSVNGNQVKQGSFTIPSGSQAFWTGYAVNGTVTVKATLEVFDLNSGDNEKSVSCSSASHTCW